MSIRSDWFTSPEYFAEQALDQRMSDYDVVRAWVVDQVEHNPARIIGEIASMLVGAPGPYPVGYDYRNADAQAVSDMRDRMSDAIADQDATQLLAEQLKDDADAEAEESERDAAYWDACDASIPNIPNW